MEPLAEGSVEVQCVARKRSIATFHIPAAILTPSFLGASDELRIDSDIPYLIIKVNIYSGGRIV